MPDNEASANKAARRWAQVSRKSAVWSFLVLSAATAAAANLTWFSGVIKITGQVKSVSVSGHQVAPAVTAIALVALAAALFLAMSGRIGQWVATSFLALAGAAIAVVASSLLANPQSALFTQISSATGGGALTFTDISTPPFGYLTVGLGAVILVRAIVVMANVRDWPAGKSKYDRPGASAVPGAPDSRLDERDAWDALSAGEDPSAAEDPGDESRP